MNVQNNSYQINYRAKLKLEDVRLRPMLEKEVNGPNKKALKPLIKEFRKMYPNTVIECTLSKPYIKQNIYTETDLVLKNTRNGEVREFTVSTDAPLISEPTPFAEAFKFLTNLARSEKFWGKENPIQRRNGLIDSILA